jgi:FtsZ-binding cell division protein ZapB
LTKAAETIIAEDTIASLCQRIAKLEAEKNTLQHTVENGNEDYDLLLEGNKSLLAERDNFHNRCEDLRAELMEVRSSTEKQITDLEAEVKCAEAHSTDVAGAGEKKILRMNWFMTWRSCARCMCATLRLLEAHARRCPRASLPLWIIFDGCLQRYSVLQICLTVLMKILLPSQSKVLSPWLAILLI